MVKVLLQVDAWGARLSPCDELKDIIIPLPRGVDVEDPVPSHSALTCFNTFALVGERTWYNSEIL